MEWRMVNQLTEIPRESMTYSGQPGASIRVIKAAFFIS